MYYNVAMTNQRFLYYVPWCITDGTMMAFGIGYNGRDEKTKEHKFDRIISIYILEIEFGLSPVQMMVVSYPFLINMFRISTGTI
jgi:hypothetical protein